MLAPKCHSVESQFSRTAQKRIRHRKAGALYLLQCSVSGRKEVPPSVVGLVWLSPVRNPSLLARRGPPISTRERAGQVLVVTGLLSSSKGASQVLLRPPRVFYSKLSLPPHPCLQFSHVTLPNLGSMQATLASPESPSQVLLDSLGDVTSTISRTSW